MHEKTNKSSSFWDRIAQSYAASPIRDQKKYQQKLARTRRTFTPNQHWLEIGCGTGSTALMHAPHIDYIHAIDFSQAMIDIAQEKARQANIKNIRFECTTLEKVAPVPSSLDGVLALNVLHLIPHPEQMIRQIYLALKPGGVFVSNTVCLGNKFWIFHVIAPIGKFLGFLPYIKVFTNRWLLTVIQKTGFIINDEWQTDKIPSLFLIVRKPRPAKQ